jgi:hypothetical protein
VVVAVKGEGGGDDLVRHLVDLLEAADFFTPAEQAFLDDPEPEVGTRVQFAWRCECINLMLWALQILPRLDRPDAICDVRRLTQTLRNLGAAGLRRGARLRAQSDLLDAADLIYRYHWAVEDARMTGGEAPAGLDAGVVHERHYVLNWLIGHGGQDWDDVLTNT